VYNVLRRINGYIVKYVYVFHGLRIFCFIFNTRAVFGLGYWWNVFLASLCIFVLYSASNCFHSMWSFMYTAVHSYI